MSLIPASFTQGGYAKLYADIANFNSSISTTSIVYNKPQDEWYVFPFKVVPPKPKDPVQLSLFDENL